MWSISAVCMLGDISCMLCAELCGIHYFTNDTANARAASLLQARLPSMPDFKTMVQDQRVTSQNKEAEHRITSYFGPVIGH